MRFSLFFLFFFSISGAQAKLYSTFSSSYSEQRMMELVYQTNKGAYDFKKSVAILQKNFTSITDRRYISVQRKRSSKVFYPKVFIHPDSIDLKFGGKQFAQVKEINYLANSVWINNREVQLDGKKSLIKLHKELLEIVGAKENTQQSLRVLFVLIPWMTEAKVYSFEGDLNKVKGILCKNPKYRIEEKFQVVSSFIKEIEEFMKNPANKNSCALWANKSMQNIKELFNAQSLVFICEKAKRATSCIANAKGFDYKPQVLKKKSK